MENDRDFFTAMLVYRRVRTMSNLVDFKVVKHFFVRYEPSESYHCGCESII